MERTFATLYDSAYLSRGYLLLESLIINCSSRFVLYILALDKNVKSFYSRISDRPVVIVTLDEVEGSYPVLKRLREERSWKEFCWTLSSFFTQYVLYTYNVDSCTYIDSDVCFWGDPEYLLEKLDKESVLITEHGFSPEYDTSRVNGKYCVQFVYFKNNSSGKRVLEWWRSKCEEACTLDIEKGLCGDQKYLDDWVSRFPGDVYSCNSLGCLAPWNVQKIRLTLKEERYHVIDRITGVEEPVVFFHFHALRRVFGDVWKVPSNKTDDSIYDSLYKEYVGKMVEAENAFPEIAIESYSFVRETEKILFAPVPYLEQTSVLIANENNYEGVRQIDVQKDENRGSVSYRVMDNKGRWISLVKLSGSVVVENFHEILWRIQKKECYGDSTSTYEDISEIIKRVERKEKIRTECLAELFGNVMPSHPMFEVRRGYDCSNENGESAFIYMESTRKF